VRLLLDTHAAVWWLADDDRLSSRAADAIAAAAEPLLSAATLFEAAIKQSIGKLRLPADWVDTLLGEGFAVMPIRPSHSHTLSELSFVELNGTVVRDPFDRLLVAQATVEGVPIVTRDPAIGAHGTATIW
jgi:PIN domain nuclease of toxin-antitoxin system